MAQKKFISTYILIVILILLGAGIYFVKLKEVKDLSKQNQATFFYENFNQEKINNIEITEAGSIFYLKKEEENWYKEKEGEDKKIIDKQSVLTALAKIKELEVIDPVTTSQDKQNLFKVDETGMQIKFFNSDKEIANFYIGKSNPDFSGVYVRKENDNRIYEIKERLNSYFKESLFKEEQQNNEENQDAN